MKAFTLSLLLGLAGTSLARTDLAGCISSQTTNQWHEASMIWWVPESGEICEFVDCGGGRAPPKTTQPGCPLYKGTATLTPNYMPGWGPNGKMAATTTSLAENTSSPSSSKSKTTDDSTESAVTVTDSMVTPAPTSSPAVSMTTTTSPISKLANSTSSATTTTPTGNAAGAFSPDMGGIMAMAAAVIFAMAA